MPFPFSPYNFALKSSQIEPCAPWVGGVGLETDSYMSTNEKLSADS